MFSFPTLFLANSDVLFLLYSYKLQLYCLPFLICSFDVLPDFRCAFFCTTYEVDVALRKGTHWPLGVLTSAGGSRLPFEEATKSVSVFFFPSGDKCQVDDRKMQSKRNKGLLLLTWDVRPWLPFIVS